MNKEMIFEKQKQAMKIMEELDIDVWMTYLRESSTSQDPMMEMIVGTGCTWSSAFILTRTGETIAIVGSLEVPNMKLVGTFNTVIGYLKGIKDDLVTTMNKLNPKKIAINFSRNSSLADGISHGMFLELMENLSATPFKDRIVSSEEIIGRLRGRKSPAEIALMKEAIKETLRIFDEVTGFIQPGISEKEVAEFVRGKVKERGFGLAWDAEHCPAVFTGPDTAGAHAGPTDKKIERGHVINMDFGIKINGYCSDLQRTWYVLREGETEVPAEVKRGFDVIVDSISMAANELKPGKVGWEIDDVARQYIVRSGYEEFPHGLGHQLGRAAHDAGGLLCPRWERYANLPYIPIEENQIFTIEPRLTVPGFGIATVEEEVVVTKDGCEFISPRQTEIYVVK